MSPVRDTASAVVAPADVADHATSVMLHHVFAENVPMLGRELAATAQVQMYTTPPAADYSAVPVLMSLGVRKPKSTSSVASATSLFTAPQFGGSKKIFRGSSSPGPSCGSCTVKRYGSAVMCSGGGEYWRLCTTSECV